MQRCICRGSKQVAFPDVRNGCRALKEIIIPDNIADDYFRGIHAPYDLARHRPMFYLAWKRGDLWQLTECVHRQVIARIDKGEQLDPGYRRDLAEGWYMQSDELGRHQKGRGFMGKYVELKFATMVENVGSKIHGLAAFGALYDVVAEDEGGRVTDFELKYIGVDDIDFDAGMESMQGNLKWVSSSPYEDADYVLFRAFEAGLQLKESRNHRACVIVVNSMAWGRISLAFEDNWIDWKRPKFLSKTFCSSNFMRGLTEKKPALTNLEADIAMLPSMIDELRIIVDRDYVFCEVMRPISRS